MDPLASPRQAPAAETADRKSERRKWYGKAQTALFMSVIAPFMWAVPSYSG